MGRIQSNVGLITGIPIGDTVDQLMQLAARPRDLLASRTELLQSEKLAITSLSGLLAALQLAIGKLGESDFFDRRIATSSNPSALTATVTGTPPLGSYQFTPLATVQSQQFLSSGVKSDTDPLGGGVLTFRFGANVRPATQLDRLGGGQGVTRGSIRITDRSGRSAVIDLSTARTIDDVIGAINAGDQIDVTATVSGDHIALVDGTGETVANLRVEEVSGGTTAAGLGLAGIDVAADSAEGSDLLWLARDLDLDFLNDSAGVFTDPVLDDIRYTLRDGTVGEIDLSPILAGSSDVDRETTLGEILDRINAAEPGKLHVDIAADGRRLVITDLTSGSGDFTLESLHDSRALADLGLDTAASGGQITGRRILGGLRTVLLGSLDGGQGLGDLGQVQLTDRSGASATVDLSAAETLADVIDLLGSSGVGVTARVNAAGSGIELVDTSGGSGNLTVTSADATATAEKLGIAVDADVTSVDGGDLHLKVVSHNTRLDDFHGGAGVARGIIQVTDSLSRRDQLNLADDDIQTIGDVIRAINRLDADVYAELNETGDGIRIRDLAGGPSQMEIADVGSSAAADLGIAGTAVDADLGGQTVQVIDGATTRRIELDAGDSLADLRDKINALDAGLSATILNDGSTRPYRLSLVSQQPGTKGALVVDASGLGLDLNETARARDALLVYGDPASPGSNVLISSSSNTFDSVVTGLSLQVQQASAVPVTITVEGTDEDFIAGVQAMVDAYNKFRNKLDELTAYDAETETASVLTGDATALRLDTDLAYFFSGRIAGAGTVQALAEVGIDLGKDGTLSLDQSKLEGKYAADPDAVREFFTNEEFGVSARLDGLIERLAGEDSSLLSGRLDTLTRKIDRNQERIQFMEDRLEQQRERLLLQFYRLETVIGKMQTSMNAISSIQALPSLVSRSSSRNSGT